VRKAFLKAFSLTLGAATLSACASLAPEYRRPEPQLPATFTGAGDALQSAPAQAGAWWQAFGDEALNALVLEALDANRSLRAAVARLEAARARRGRAAQDYLPSGGVTAARARRKFADAQGGGRSDTWSAAFDASWELDLFGRVSSSVRAADARLGAAEASLDDVRLTIAAEVARTYFEWRGSQQRGEILAAFITDQATVADLTAVRFENGAASPDDLGRARAQLAADRAALLAEQDRQRRLRHALAVLTGRNPGAWQGPPAPPLAAMTVQTLAIGDPAALIRRRPDIRQAERQLAASVADIGVATADLFPQVNIGGFVGYVAGNAGDLGSGASLAWQAAPTISWGLLKLGRVRANIRAGEAESRAALADYEQAVLRALEDAENAFGSYGIAQQRLKALLDQARESRLAAQISRVRYEEGETDYLRALDAARGARAAETALVEGLVEQRVATLAVHKALGAMP